MISYFQKNLNSGWIWPKFSFDLPIHKRSFWYFLRKDFTTITHPFHGEEWLCQILIHKIVALHFVTNRLFLCWFWQVSLIDGFAGMWITTAALPGTFSTPTSTIIIVSMQISIVSSSSYHTHIPSNAKATFVQSTQMQRFLKTIQTLSCWYSLESSHGALSDVYPFARVSVIFQDFCISLYWPN